MMSLRLRCRRSGRGPLAGAVFAAAVILNPQRRINRLIRKCCRLNGARSWRCEFENDRSLGQLRTRRWKRSIRSIFCAPACPPCSVRLNNCRYCLRKFWWTDCIAQCHDAGARNRGRSTPAISAASILAKTARDAEMRRLAEQYPHYGFEHNMGYGTPEHLLALQTHGACSIHRRTFAPVYAVLEFELRG